MRTGLSQSSENVEFLETPAEATGSLHAKVIKPPTPRTLHSSSSQAAEPPRTAHQNQSENPELEALCRNPQLLKLLTRPLILKARITNN